MLCDAQFDGPRLITRVFPAEHHCSRPLQSDSPSSSQDVSTVGLVYPYSPSSASLTPNSEATALLPETLIPLATTNVVLATSTGLGRCQDIMADGNPEDLTGARSSRATTVVTPPFTGMALRGFEGISLMTTTITSFPPPRTWEANRKGGKRQNFLEMLYLTCLSCPATLQIPPSLISLET
ncbi:hypothetical protein NC651_035599 [Populus alba x Populus x berolinensis]|nr:hypothetical protein NC651_035599 [Populus alba x Populus x berolinensis]